MQIFDAGGALVCDEQAGARCASATAYAFNAQRHDAQTGLYDYKSRFYSSALRAFLSPDPAGFADSFDPFAYVAHDPLNLVDPFGLSTNRGGLRQPNMDPFALASPPSYTRGDSDDPANWTPERRQTAINNL